jgi:hypothetical protein
MHLFHDLHWRSKPRDVLAIHIGAKGDLATCIVGDPL